MFGILIFLVIGLFVALLFLNVYFRVKVLKEYKYLVNNRVEFTTSDIFNKRRMQEEVIVKYPQHRDSIESFVKHIKFSVNIAMMLIVLITLFGGILMYFRHS